MEISSKIYIAGHRGLVGSALVRRLQAGGYKNLITRTHFELDLLDQRAVQRFFEMERPEYVFLAAARVGGILANISYPADFIYQNLLIQVNVIHSAYLSGVRKLLFLGSSCIYPKHTEQPMKEESLLSGALESTNEPYAIAKIAGIKQCAAYNRQYGTDFVSVMPTNLYGPGDNYHPLNSHVLPALISRFHAAKVDQRDEVIVWGTGTPRREFLYCDDAADACVFVMERYGAGELGEFANVGTGTDITIEELACVVKRVVGYSGVIRFDHSRPDGTPRKLLDVSRLDALGWRASTDLETGLRNTYDAFLRQSSAGIEAAVINKHQGGT
jgi:GDP-L-fucose synthase